MSNQPTKKEAVADRKNMYISHFERELEIMRKQVPENDELIIEPYVDAVKAVCEAFAEVGHSGGSAPMASAVLAKTIKAVLGFQILSPLLGDDSEWKEPRDGDTMRQNIRDTAVFKHDDGKCTYNNCIIWRGEDAWDTFSGTIAGIGSSHYVKEFPFMPKTFYIDVYREPYDENNPKHQTGDVISCGPGDMVYFIKDPKQLEQVFNYYDKRELNEKSN